jgi:hypothetical protein
MVPHAEFAFMPMTQVSSGAALKERCHGDQPVPAGLGAVRPPLIRSLEASRALVPKAALIGMLVNPTNVLANTLVGNMQASACATGYVIRDSGLAMLVGAGQ